MIILATAAVGIAAVPVARSLARSLALTPVVTHGLDRLQGLTTFPQEALGVERVVVSVDDNTSVDVPSISGFMSVKMARARGGGGGGGRYCHEAIILRRVRIIAAEGVNFGHLAKSATLLAISFQHYDSFHDLTSELLLRTKHAPRRRGWGQRSLYT